MVVPSTALFLFGSQRSSLFVFAYHCAALLFLLLSFLLPVKDFATVTSSRMFSKRVLTFLTLALACLSSQAKEEADEAAEYGVDVSFPIQHNKVSTNYAWLPHNLDITEELPKEFEGEDVQHLGNRQTFYNDFLKGCVDHFGNKGNRCTTTEKDRIEMALRQPQSMQVCSSLSLCHLARENYWESLGRRRRSVTGGSTSAGRATPTSIPETCF